MTRIVSLALAAGLAVGLATAAQAGGFGGPNRGSAAGYATGSAVFDKVQLLRGHTDLSTDANGVFQMSVHDDVVTGRASL